MNNRAERILQLSVVLACFIVLTAKWTVIPSTAQIVCNGQPPIKDNIDPWSYFALKANSWPPGTSAVSKRQITVVIYDTTTTQAGQMNEGIQTWNSFSDCANVNFNTATPAVNPSGTPPADALWVTRGVNTQVFPRTDANNQMIAADIRIHDEWSSGVPNALRGLLRHETGHTFGLNNAVGVDNSVTIMAGPYQEIRSCDTEAVRRVYCAAPTPTPTPTPPHDPPYDPPYCGPGSAAPCWNWQAYCGCVEMMGWWNDWDCRCEFYTPIVIDTTGNGFSLTNAANGVDFDLDADGVTERLSWTSAGSDDVWLALDRNGNNYIDDGTELFGNYTPQPEPPAGEMRNGFLSLAVFDDLVNGGNGDNQIDQRDAVFNRLRLWRDANHNGVSDAGETRRLSVSPIRVLELDYRESRRRDEHGNGFKYRAIVRDERGAQVGRWAWDVFLRRELPNTMSGLTRRPVEFSALNASCGLLR